ncbi:MAG: hypothetical protein NTV22_14010 [bacterium]|nr:hypothetical protein [bacterium]
MPARRLILMFSCLLFASLVCAPRALAATPTKAEALKDWTALVALHTQVREPLDKYQTGFLYDKPAEQLAAFAVFEKNDLPKIKAMLASFGAKYGTTPGDIENKIFPIVGRSDLRSAGSTYQELQRGYTGACALRKNMGDKLLQEAGRTLEMMPNYAESTRAERYDEVKTTLALAAQFDPDNATIKAKLAAIDKDKYAAQGKTEQERDARQWPGHFKGFAGPGNVKDLVKASFAFLVNAPDWGASQKNPCEIVAIAIKGNWWAIEKNMLGQVTQWGLPVYVAVASNKGDPKNVTVFELSMCTADGNKAPPFNSVAVGDNFTMRRNNVTGGSGGGGGTTGGMLGSLLWLGLALANIIAGLLAAAPLLAIKAPQLAVVYRKLTPFRNLIGVLTLAIGVLSFLWALLHFSLLSGILPQLSAMAVGLFLGKELLMRKPAMAAASGASAQKVAAAADAAALKAQELLIKYQSKIALLDVYQVPIGIACIVLGVLHLLISGARFF